MFPVDARKPFALECRYVPRNKTHPSKVAYKRKIQTQFVLCQSNQRRRLTAILRDADYVGPQDERRKNKLPRKMLANFFELIQSWR